ncbi:MAG TPA: VOC family protein [Rhizomicrobium sp.]|jgi:predicted 3-demethylubiquinone-9 3-methyltransferase (glyoxalase superfamily)
MKNISPCLWFDNQAEEAAEFYVSLFPNSRIKQVNRYTDAGPGREGDVMVVVFELNGQEHVALNGGPLFHFNEAVSLQIHCQGQAEVDLYWDALTKNGGTESRCGWLKDKYGLSWQVTPVEVLEMIQDSDPAKAARAMKAMMPMAKLDIAKMKQAFDGG